MVNDENDFISVRARKQHHCSQCGRLIEQGQKYFKFEEGDENLIYCDICKTKASYHRSKVFSSDYEILGNLMDIIIKVDDKKIVIEDDKTNNYKYFRFLALFFSLVNIPLAVIMLCFIPSAYPDIKLVFIIVSLISLGIPTTLFLIAFYYKNKIFQWIIDKKAGVIIHQQTAPILRELRRFSLQELIELVFIKQRKLFWNGFYGDKRFKFFTAFRFQGNELVTFWFERGEFPGSSNYEEKLGRYLAEFLNVPFSTIISNKKNYIFLGFLLFSLGGTIVFTPLMNEIWAFFLACFTATGLYLSVPCLAHWYYDRKEIENRELRLRESMD
ncbi:MAG TPA: hypothetical protein VMV49_02960 [Candidatus Deferrimicrobium sp.]|nr:hypothetical protein [Candidatus Deferrimicrobium sp.]